MGPATLHFNTCLDDFASAVRALERAAKHWKPTSDLQTAMLAAQEDVFLAGDACMAAWKSGAEPVPDVPALLLRVDHVVDQAQAALQAAKRHHERRLRSGK